ncbi:hypothetical protein ACP4OV_015120 [Aristida adscensionis]
MDGIGTPAYSSDGSASDIDAFILSAFDYLDGCLEFGTGTSAPDDILSSFRASPEQQLLHISTSLPHSVNSDGQSDASVTEHSDCSGSLAYGEPMGMSTATVPKQIHGATLPDRMLKALAILKEASSRDAILAQVWMPVRNGENPVLTTSDQPFLLDERLTGYREVSRQFTFAATQGPGQFPGLPGRVFLSGLPEWTSNVMYYSASEYMRIEHAIRHEVRGSLGLPVFDCSGGSCCAVLEVVMTQEKDNFASEIDDLCDALQSVNLSTVKAWTNSQIITGNQKSAYMEILDVLRITCRAHMLPLALVWVPLCSSKNANVSVEHGDQDINFALRNKDLLCIHESACYVNDIRMHDFVRACAEHPLERGQGVAGNAMLTNNPFFSSDVRDYDMHDYPLAQHARKFGLCAAVAIRLRSTFTGKEDYVLECFLPLLCKGSEEQQLLLDKISVTLQRVCKSLRTVSDAELMEDNKIIPSKEKGLGMLCSSSGISIYPGRDFSIPCEIKTNIPPQNQMDSNNEQLGDIANKLKSSITSHGDKRRSSTQKNVSLSVLKQYFSGSLRDAAKSIGVCPTTLKRICRQHGISRWPSRKIKKVNRSLEKIQDVISSVQGVEGELKYDPATGGLISSVSSCVKPSVMHVEFEGSDPLPIKSEFSTQKFESCCDMYQRECQGLHMFKVHEGNKTDLNLTDGGLFQDSHAGSMSDGRLSADTTSSVKTDLWIAGAQHKDVSRDSIFMPKLCKTETETKNIEQCIPSSSSMTDCSSDSALTCETFKKCFKVRPAYDRNMTITVKATYKADKLRFRLLPTMKYQHLLDEIAKRLKLSIGSFQLKYMDDEDEWVLLESEGDLEECLDVVGTTGLHILKVQVRDVPDAARSSFCSSSILGT